MNEAYETSEDLDQIHINQISKHTAQFAEIWTPEFDERCLMLNLTFDVFVVWCWYRGPSGGRFGELSRLPHADCPDFVNIFARVA